jgi:hypothetical protein
MVRRRLSVLPTRQSERNWRAYQHGSDNLRDGACLEGERSLGLVDGDGNERPGSSPAGTPRISRPWVNFVTTAKPLAEPRVMDDSSVERLGLRRRAEGSVLEAAGKPPFVGPNGSAASLGVAALPIGAELPGIPARKRQPAKRCLSERETVARPRGRLWQRKARQ